MIDVCYARWRSVGVACLSAGMLSLCSPRALAQGIVPSAGNGAAPATQAGAAATTVLEPGDVYLPGSRVYAFVSKTGFGHEHGVVGQLLPSKLRLDAQQDAGQLNFDMRTFAADSDLARKYVGLAESTPPATQREVNTNMLGTAVLDAGRFPTASFAVHSAARIAQPGPRGMPQYQIGGDFTLHGVTRPIQIVAEAEEQQGWTHLRGGFILVQSQFGITPFTKAFGAVGVADEVKVYGDLWIARERQVVAAAPAPANR